MVFNFDTANLYEKYGVIYKTGDIIFFEGDYGHDFYIIYSGSVKIVKFTNGNMRVLRILKEGSLFGEIAFFCENIRTATTIAETDVKLIKINYNSLYSIINGNESFGWDFLALLSERVEYTLELFESLHQVSNERKLLRLLSYVICCKKSTINLDELHGMLGLSKDEVSEIIEHWKKFGLLTIDNGIITTFNEVLVKQLIAFNNNC